MTTRKIASPIHDVLFVLNALKTCFAKYWNGVGAEVAACYLVQECSRGETKHGKPFLRLVLADRSGTIMAMVWEDALRCEPICQPSSIVGVRGVVQPYDGKRQINVVRVEPLDDALAAEQGMTPLVSHGLYLMNLGAPDREVPSGPPDEP